MSSWAAVVWALSLVWLFCVTVIAGTVLALPKQRTLKFWWTLSALKRLHLTPCQRVWWTFRWWVGV